MWTIVDEITWKKAVHMHVTIVDEITLKKALNMHVNHSRCDYFKESFTHACEPQ